MNEGRDAQPAANALGVVDPIRIPIPTALPRAWRRLPLLGRVFVGLAIVDIVARAIGFAGTSLFLDLASPLTLLTAFVPHDLLVLFPALLLLRRPDADRATPLVLRGAVLIALIELLGEPLGNLVTSSGSADAFGAPLLVYVAVAALTATGWILIAIGLIRLAPAPPTQFLAGLSNLVFAAIAALSLVYLVGALVGPPSELGSPIVDGLFLLNSTTLAVGLVAWGFLGRVIVRGAGDARRPLAARRLALGAFAIIAATSALDAVIGTVLVGMRAFGPGIEGLGQLTMDAVTFISATGSWLGLIATSSVIVAFALGLADTSPRVPAGAPNGGAEPDPEPPAWPAPAGSSTVSGTP